MAKKITRRSFLKGTGKTILTAGVLSSGIGLSTSTTPTTVVPKAMSWKNLNVLSPKAKAYRTYLKGIRMAVRNTWASGGPALGVVKKVITHQRVSGGIKATTGSSIARQAFEQSISKGDQVGSQKVRGKYSLASDVVAKTIASDPRPGEKVWSGSAREKQVVRTSQIRRLSKTLHATGRTILAKELRIQRKLTQTLRKKGIKAMVKESNKIKGAKVGGGGKMALPGLESAKNPTGMSLITQRYTL